MPAGLLAVELAASSYLNVEEQWELEVKYSIVR